MDPIETLVIADLTARIYHDEDAENPRRDGSDNVGHTAFFHRRYSLGDAKPTFRTPADFLAWQTTPEGKASVVLPVFMYDHSGLTVRTTPFTCPWDSGQLGWIFATPDDIRHGWCRKRITAALRAKVADCLRAEVAALDEYLGGNVFYYTITDKTGNVLDACGGCYGLEETKSLIRSEYGKAA